MRDGDTGVGEEAGEDVAGPELLRGLLLLLVMLIGEVVALLLLDLNEGRDVVCAVTLDARWAFLIRGFNG